MVREIIKYVGLYTKHLLLFSDFKQNQVFMNFSKNLKYEIAQISVLWEYSILCRQTDMTKLTITVHNCSANAPKKITSHKEHYYTAYRTN